MHWRKSVCRSRRQFYSPARTTVLEGITPRDSIVTIAHDQAEATHNHYPIISLHADEVSCPRHRRSGYLREIDFTGSRSLVPLRAISNSHDAFTRARARLREWFRPACQH